MIQIWVTLVFPGGVIRDILNSILTFIGAENLTDDEFDGLTISAAAYDAITYAALDELLSTRQAVSSQRDRLTFFFKAKGVDISSTDQGTSNILIGSVLC